MEKIPRKEMIFSMLLKEPNDVFLNYALAMEYLASHDFNEAANQLKKVLTFNSDYLPCFYQLGQVHEKLGNNDVAISFYKKGIEIAKLQNNTKALGELNEAVWMLED